MTKCGLYVEEHGLEPWNTFLIAQCRNFVTQSIDQIHLVEILMGVLKPTPDKLAFEEGGKEPGS